MSCRRNGFRKKVTQTKEGPLALRREKGKVGGGAGREEGEGKAQAGDGNMS